MITPATAPVPWRLFVASTVSGTVVADVPFVGNPQWGARLNEVGSLQVDVPLGGTGIDKADLDGYVASWRWTWGLAYGSCIVQAGPVVGERYDGTSQHTTIAATGLWGLFSGKRVLVNPAWSPGLHWEQATYDVILDGSLHTIAKRLIETDLSRTGHQLPIVLPEDIAGTAQRTYYGYDLAYVGARLQELTQVDDGPEVEFRPEWTDSTHSAIQWRMRIGNPRLGQLGYPHAWDYGQALTTVGVDTDGSTQTFGHWCKGDGMERTTTGSYVEDRSLVDGVGGNYGWPMLEDVDSDHSSARDFLTLRGWSTAYVATHHYGTRLLSATVRVDGTDGQGHQTGSPSLDVITSGDNARLTVRGHRRLPDGTYSQRILGLGPGPDLSTVALTLQETMEAAT